MILMFPFWVNYNFDDSSSNTGIAWIIIAITIMISIITCGIYGIVKAFLSSIKRYKRKQIKRKKYKPEDKKDE